MNISVQLDRKKKILTIKMPLEAPRPSASGKTTLIASTRGVQTTDVAYRGRPVAIVANAFFFNDRRDRKLRTRLDPSKGSGAELEKQSG